MADTTEVRGVVLGYFTTALAQRVAALETLLAGVTRTTNNGYDTIRFNQVNLQLTNGTGNTYGPNGYGNLIVGYDAPRADALRSGSHNIVVGDWHSCPATAGAVFGISNTISSMATTVTGGVDNSALGNLSSVSGGNVNVASGAFSSITGGTNDGVTGPGGTITGGSYNTVAGVSGSVTGGRGNEAEERYSSITGGYDNRVTGRYGSVTGGRLNVASAESSSVTGGYNDLAQGLYGTVSGGKSRFVIDTYDWRAGGLFQDL